MIVDGAHNRNGARVLAATLRDLLPGRPLILVIGVLGDKDTKEICRPLLPLFRKVIAVAPPSARALAASRLARIIRSQTGERKIPILVRKSLESALAYCYRNYLPGREGAGTHPVVCVTGSLRLIGPARNYLFSRRGSEQ